MEEFQETNSTNTTQLMLNNHRFIKELWKRNHIITDSKGFWLRNIQSNKYYRYAGGQHFPIDIGGNIDTVFTEIVVQSSESLK
jgi:hypothetical protein